MLCLENCVQLSGFSPVEDINNCDYIVDMKCNTRKALLVIYTLAILNVVVLMLCMGPMLLPDSYTYIEAWNKSLSSCHIDIYRTPLYPVFLGLCKFLFGSRYLNWVIVIQNMLFLVSIRFFWDTLHKVTSSRTISFWITVLYSVSPGMVALNNYILTESFAIVLSVFIAHALLSLLSSKSWWVVIRFSILLFLLVFLRPAQVYYLPVLLFILGCMSFFSDKRTIALKCLSGVFSISILFLLYVWAFHSTYKVYSPSGISVVNQFYIGRSRGLISLDNLNNPAIGHFLVDSLYATNPQGAPYYEAYSAIDHLGLEVLDDEIHHSMRQNPGGWVKAIGSRLHNSGGQPLYNFGPFLTIRGPFSIKMSSVYCFLIIVTILLCFVIIYNNNIPWFTASIFLLSLANMAVSILGSQSDWGRLALPSVPFLLLIFGIFCSFFKVDLLRFSHIF